MNLGCTCRQLERALAVLVPEWLLRRSWMLCMVFWVVSRQHHSGSYLQVLWQPA